MPKLRLGKRDVIATRTYITPEHDFTVTVRRGRPRRAAGSTAYHCIDELREPGHVWTWPLLGSDAFKAIQLALLMLGTNFQHIQELLGCKLTGTGSSAEPLGLPTYPDFSVMPPLPPKL